MTTVLDGHRLIGRLPKVRGKLTPMREMAGLTWFQVGGPAEVLFQPADEDDLADFLKACPDDVPVTPVGIGSNLLVRDGGIFGVVIRLGRGFNAVEAQGARVTAGAAVPDALVAKKAAAAGIGGLEFLRGVPGTIGGALTMNAGCYGREIKDVLVEARAIDRAGDRLTFTAEEMGFSYRHAEAAERDLVWTGAVLEGREEDADAVTARMEALVDQREASQPIREKTGGSTFRNPAGHSSTGAADDTHELKAWKLIDEAGCRGLTVGDAQVSEKHCNFLVNRGAARAEDLEELGETVRARVQAHSGHDLHWEIRRIGVKLPDPAAI
ncbi:MAG TPA: UDP-N-acetylmuramate dehydrogenase [Thermohalobaculum sp.]|nr:UDP-N-acetylmuramate dehydrogenase [Thermohalobaculum sp.]